MSFFDLPAFVISCEDDSERRALTKKRLDEQNIKFEFFNATNGHNLPNEFFTSKNIFIEHPGGRGVAHSNIRLWQKIVDENIENAIIFEDDVVFYEHFGFFAEMLWKESPRDSIIFLGYCCLHLNEGGKRIGKIQIIEGFPLALHAYIISKKVAQWFLDHLGIMNQSVDLHMRDLYYKESKDWKSFCWWNGNFTSTLQGPTKMGVFFNGFCYQDHDMPLAIHRDRNKITV